MQDIIPQDATPLKQCANPACKQWFPATLEYFHKDRNTHDKLATRCKPCKRADNNYAHAHPHPKEVLPDGYKRCTGCNELKLATLEYFQAQKKGLYGLDSACKICRSEKRKSNADHRHEVMRRWNEAHKEYRRLYNQQYGITHREEIRLQSREYYKTHPRSPEVARIKNHRRRAHHLAASGSHTVLDIQTQYERQKGKCYYCSKKLGAGRRSYHVDHVIPLSRGGSNDPSNLVIACPSCNFSKHNRLPHEWPRGGRLL